MERTLTSGTSSTGMESSVLRFKNLNVVVGKKKNTLKSILSDVSGRVKFGHVLAILGPSGAGKTTLINALTLSAFYGKQYGSVTLNGIVLNEKIFEQHCYVVVQRDKHWPFLTCRETLLYAAELYDVANTKADMQVIVNDIIDKMGLTICAETRNSGLSGGQARRLSIAVALLKNPTLLFLDEPTSGLDAAAAENIMKEIVQVAKKERLIVLCTIHQPSTKVYNGFDEVMILSKGREAFSGKVQDAGPYFGEIGHPLPEQTNPAEHFLDIVNSDFSSDAVVDKILNTWEETRPDGGSSHHRKGFDVDGDEGQNGVAHLEKTKFGTELSILFRRHFWIMCRDPILYTGRIVGVLIVNTVFGLVYFKTREYSQSTGLAKMWVTIWHMAVAANMGVVAVYALNDEFKSVVRETKNGMIRPLSYAVAKTVLVIPIMFLYAIAALGVPSFAIMDFPGDSFGKAVLLWSALLYVYECIAEFVSVWVEDPILGMMAFMNFWFGSFLFGGFLIPQRDMFYPFEAFYHIMPFSYYIRAQMYNFLADVTFDDTCDPNNNVERSPVCVNSTEGVEVLEGIGKAYPVVEASDTYVEDLAVLVALAVFYKLLFFAGCYVKGSRVSKILPSHGYTQYLAEESAAMDAPSKRADDPFHHNPNLVKSVEKSRLEI